MQTHFYEMNFHLPLSILVIFSIPQCSCLGSAKVKHWFEFSALPHQGASRETWHGYFRPLLRPGWTDFYKAACHFSVMNNTAHCKSCRARVLKLTFNRLFFFPARPCVRAHACGTGISPVIPGVCWREMRFLLHSVNSINIMNKHVLPCVCLCI